MSDGFTARQPDAGPLGAGGSGQDPTGAGPLSIVLPAYNEGESVRAAVASVRAAAEAAQWPVRFVIVDDGGDDLQSRLVLDQLGREVDVKVVTLPHNQGRYAARKIGLDQVDTPYVLMLDARVEVELDSFVELRKQVELHDRTVWNFNVEPAGRSPFALFWTGITKVWWRDYYRHKRHVAFGVESFNRYPKGTGAFFAPTAVLRAAIGSFSSLYDDPTLASDDTRLLREVAARRPINIAPNIVCRHRAKAGASAWMRQCRYRGTTFVDGYLEHPNQARLLLIVAAAGIVFGGVWGLRRPRRIGYASVVASVSAARLTSWAGGTRRESVSVGLLTTPFAVLFGSGVLRGLTMAVRRRR